VSKAMLAFLIVAGVVAYDPPAALGLLGSQGQTIGWKLKYTFDRMMPNPGRR
jgi:hypothetical protein